MIFVAGAFAGEQDDNELIDATMQVAAPDAVENTEQVGEEAVNEGSKVLDFFDGIYNQIQDFGNTIGSQFEQITNNNPVLIKIIVALVLVVISIIIIAVLVLVAKKIMLKNKNVATAEENDDEEYDEDEFDTSKFEDDDTGEYIEEEYDEFGEPVNNNPSLNSVQSEEAVQVKNQQLNNSPSQSSESAVKIVNKNGIISTPTTISEAMNNFLIITE
ncbi:hypothetical protein IJG14_01045 [bacterium]|nr:hypothetical protein [bacterium]